MQWVVWLAVAALTMSGCAGENALYTNPKYVPGYKPGGGTAQAYDRAPRLDWRQL